MDTERYKVLLKVIEVSNFTKAAEELGLTQSAVSHTIKSMEDELGIPLLMRGKRESSINPCVNELLPYIQELLHIENNIEQVANQIRGLERGTLRIGCFTSVSVHWLPELLKEFSQKHPYIQIELTDGTYEQVEEWILSGKVDCGFITLPPHEKIETIVLYRDKLMAVLPKNHPLAVREIISLADLAEESFITPGEGIHYNLGQILKENHAAMNTRYSVKDDYVTISFIKNELGVSILPELVLRDFTDEVAIRELKESTYRTLGLGIKSQNITTPIAKKFISYVQMKFNTVLPEKSS